MADVEMEPSASSSSSKLASPPPPPPPSKRKAGELVPSSSQDIVIVEEKAAPEKKRKVELKKKPTLVKLQGAKFSLLQKPIPSLLSGSTSTLKDLIDWQTFYQGLSEPLDGLPEQFYGLVVRLCHESEKAILALAKEVRSKLIPQDLGDTTNLDALTVAYLETLISSLLTRTNYGLSPAELDLASTAKPPAGLSIWRWETIDRPRYLPAEALAQLEARVEEREKAKVEVLAIWSGLSSADRDSLLSKTTKGKERAKSVSVEPEGSKAKSPSKSPVKESKPKKEKVLDPEAAAKKAERDQKEQEKAERRAVREAKTKEKEEKDKKAAEVKNKQAATMASFFKKPAAPVKRPALTTVASSSTSDFQKTFLPFEEKKDTTLAPINRFAIDKANNANGKGKGRSTSPMDLDEQTCDFLSPKDLLRKFVRSVPSSQLPRSAKYALPGLKSGPLVLSVRELVQQSQEAELSGTGDPREITEALQDEKQYRRKYLKFREDLRPPYYGTWTQPSFSVGPRTPFARDPARDYSYDSADDWEEELDGEDLDNLDSPRKARRKSLTPSAGGGGTVGGDMWDTDDEDGDFGSEEEEEEDSDADGEDSWMVDEAEGEESGSRGASPIKEELPESAFAPLKGRELDKKPVAKAKPIKIQRQKGWGKKKKKLDAKGMVPVIRGPFFEKELGVCEYAGFESYRIQMLNDTPFPIDPFTFVAAPVKADPNPPPQISSIASSVPRRVSGMPPPATLASSSHTASAPSGQRILASSSSHPNSSPIATTSTSSTQHKASSPSITSSSILKAAPKNPFPTTHLRDFLIDISQSTKPVVGLVSELSEKWKPFGVKKVQIEYELKRRAKRQGRADGSPWVILEESWNDVPGGKPT